MPRKVRLTRYSHGSGCGCKISPAILDKILTAGGQVFTDKNLIVGNDSRDDAAVYALDGNRAIISTTDFFMPIVDDPFDFGQIAAANALSDIYAMGGTPIISIAILGWPLSKLVPETAQEVIAGGRKVCADAGIVLAGGHSIDAPEPIFGLAATGIINIGNLKRNNTAKAGDRLYLSKPLGTGLYSTAAKKGLLSAKHAELVRNLMSKLNSFGAKISTLPQVSAMTDVTGFGLLGHLSEMCRGSGLTAIVDYSAVPLLPGLKSYIKQGCSPGGTERNFTSFSHDITRLTREQQAILCDPQTSGGLLIAVSPEGEQEFVEIVGQNNTGVTLIGRLEERGKYLIVVS